VAMKVSRQVAAQLGLASKAGKCSPKPDLGDLLAYIVRITGLPEPQREYSFAAPQRRWRFDLAWKDRMLACEAEGGSWVNGAHSRGKHFESDCQKYNEAALQGWLVLRFTAAMIRSGEALAMIKRALERNSPIHPNRSNAYNIC
jgi:hypothetical protein